MTDLDPDRWVDFEEALHEVATDLLEFVRTVRDRDVWQPPSEEAKELFAPSAAPRQGTDLETIWSELRDHVLPHLTGNLHPRFFGWAHGAGTPAGALAELIAGFLDANLAGRDQAPVYLERQVVEWCRGLFGFPPGASGLIVSGTSTGNLVGITVARDATTDWFEARRDSPEPRVYASEASHLSVRRAFRLAGFPDRSVRLVPTDDARRLDPEELRARLERDRAEGHEPVMVVGTVGTSGTGAIDPLPAIADLCEEHDLWLHVDGAFGALSFLSPDPPAGVPALTGADSVAFDFHKWFHVPYAAGCVLVQDREAHLDTYSVSAPYADAASGALGGGRPWPTALGPEMSRGFRALKTWVTIRHFGVDRLVRQIDETRELAASFADWIRDAGRLELWPPVELNIVCCRYRNDAEGGPGEENRLQERIVETLQASGVAAPSATTVDGRVYIRVAIFNHRTTMDDLLLLGREILRVGEELAKSEDAPPA